MTSTYRQNALDGLGQQYAPLLDAIAERLHRNESAHMHNLTEDVDIYCWMRAEHALIALRTNNSLQVVDAEAPQQQDTAASPYGWALWRLDGALYACVQGDPDPDAANAGWETVFAHYRDVDPRSFQGWAIDPISEDDYTALCSHHALFNRPGSRNEFLVETKVETGRRTRGLPPVTGYAAWAPSGALIALNNAIRGLTGWHSLGIGDPADDVTLDALDAEEHQHLLEHTSRYWTPGGRADFHGRHPGPTAEEQPDTDFSPLVHAFSEALLDHSDADYGGTPHLVLGQYLENCLSAYGAALESREGASK